MHGPLVIRILGQGFKHTLPYTRAAPARMAQMNHAKVAKALRQIAPGHTGTVAKQHNLNKQATLAAGRPT